MSELCLPVTKIQKFCTHDGPGIRTTVFTKGCPLACQWCHNPETQSVRPQFFYNPSACVLCGRCAGVCGQGVHTFDADGHHINRLLCAGCMKCAEACPANALESASKLMTVDEILQIVAQDKAFFGTDGGLTVSGGEPMMHPEAVIALLEGAKALGMTTAVETCGFFDEAYTERLCRATDLLLWDYKDTDSERHRKNTGADNEKIIKNLALADRYDTEIRLRCIMIKGVNTDETHINGIAACFNRTEHCSAVELLPYHAYADSKYTELGMECHGSYKEWIPTAHDMTSIKKQLRSVGVKVYQ